MIVRDARAASLESRGSACSSSYRRAPRWMDLLGGQESDNTSERQRIQHSQRCVGVYGTPNRTDSGRTTIAAARIA